MRRPYRDRIDFAALAVNATLALVAIALYLACSTGTDATPAIGAALALYGGLIGLFARLGARVAKLPTLTAAALAAARAIARLVGLPAAELDAAAYRARAALAAPPLPPTKLRLRRIPSLTLTPRLLPIPR